MQEHPSHTRLLRDELQEIVAQMIMIFENSRFERYTKNPNPFNSFSSNPPSRPQIRLRWAALDPETTRIQNKLLRRYENWFNRYYGLFDNAPSEELLDIASKDSLVKSWIQYRRGQGTPNSGPEAIDGFKQAVQLFFRKLDRLIDLAKDSFILVIDTNALIDFPRIEKYGEAISQTGYLVILPSTVVGELDNLKRVHSNKEMRAKIIERVKQLKAWGNSGDILQGVKINDDVTLRMRAIEPNLSTAALSLDSTNKDDRIIATTLEIQRENPESTVVLVTLDLNLQNKAKAFQLPFVEPPESAVEDIE